VTTPTPVSTPVPENPADLKLLAEEVKTLSLSVPEAERGELRRAACALDELADVLTWFAQHEASKVIPATRWIDEIGAFRPWTRHPWFASFDYGTPWGRFLLFGLAATWNFNKPFEAGEGFMLYIADHFEFEQLRPRLRRYLAACASIQALDNAACIEAQAAIANDVGLLTPTVLLTIRDYVKLVGRLENAAEQATLPAALVADINAGRVSRIRQMFAAPAYGPSLRPAAADAPKATLYLDFLRNRRSTQRSTKGFWSRPWPMRPRPTSLSCTISRCSSAIWRATRRPRSTARRTYSKRPFHMRRQAWGERRQEGGGSTAEA
jgi:hypothetical protein